MFLFFEEGECLCLLVPPPSGVARGLGVAQGGGGAPKSCQRFKKIYARRNFNNSERKDENVVTFFFDYILDFSATSPPPPTTLQN